MSVPRCGAFVGIVAVALTFSSPLLADGRAVELAVELGGSVAVAAALPSCLIAEGRDGQLALQITVAPSVGGRGVKAVHGSCSAPDGAPAPARARYRAVRFAPESIGRTGSFCPTFSPDGRTVVYVRTGTGLVESRLETEGWTEPEPLPFSGTTSRDGDPFLSPDGSRLFFWSTRPATEGGTPAESSDLWVVERRADGWGAPRKLGAPVNDAGGEPFPAVAADGTLYFGSLRPGGRGGFDLYRARSNADGYAKPENLGIAINSPAGELDGYISPDQKVLVFASDRPGGYGKLDLYVSHRMVGGWSPARNLGPAVNGPDDESCPQLTRDGRLLLFSRSGGIYQIDAAALDDATP